MFLKCNWNTNSKRYLCRVLFCLMVRILEFGRCSKFRVISAFCFNLQFPYDIWRRRWHPTPVLSPGKSHGRRGLVGCSPRGRQESDTTERLHCHFSLSCIGEGSGNPLQCSCLENPRDREPGGLPSMGSHRVGHDWSNLAAAVTSLALDSWLYHHSKGLKF